MAFPLLGAAAEIPGLTLPFHASLRDAVLLSGPAPPVNWRSIVSCPYRTDFCINDRTNQSANCSTDPSITERGDKSVDALMIAREHSHGDEARDDGGEEGADHE